MAGKTDQRSPKPALTRLWFYLKASRGIMMQRFWQLVLGLVLSWILITPIARADDRGAQIFEAQCAGCHAGGGNIVRRGKNLKLKTLEKNQMATIEAIQTLVTQGKANMSAYSEKLTPEEITAVAAYVLDRAQANWQ
jgi:cytochrome c6